jgi:hypothetical protein
LHQPVGLISPATTLHAFGLTKKLQTAQLNMPFGVVWYCASACEILGGGSSARAEFAATPSPAAITARRVNELRQRISLDCHSRESACEQNKIVIPGCHEGADPEP